MPTFLAHDQSPLIAVEGDPEARALGGVIGPHAMLVDEAGIRERPGRDLRVGYLLVVVEDELAAAGDDGNRGIDPESPTRHVHPVDAVISQLAGAPVPEPVPVVMETIGVKRTIRGGPLPHGVI